MIVPLPGTRGHDEFMRKAKDPNSMESKILQGMLADSASQAQGQVRGMLEQMIQLVPGQLFRDIALFHDKFGLSPTEDPGHMIPVDLLRFRIKFMLEELEEYCEATGCEVRESPDGGFEVDPCIPEFNAEKAFDALIDLVYVALGTAFLHRFPFNQGWARVQEANMAKVRADGADDPRSLRKHSADIVKPEGWKPPVLSDLLSKKVEDGERLNP